MDSEAKKPPYATLPPEVMRATARGIGAGIADAIFRAFTETTKVAYCGDCPFEPDVPSDPSCMAPGATARKEHDRQIGSEPDPVSAHMEPGSGVPRWCPLRAGTVRVGLWSDEDSDAAGTKGTGGTP